VRLTSRLPVVGALAAVLPAALLAGCAFPADEAPRTGSGSNDRAATDPRGGDEPLTPRALAAVVAQHTGEPSSATVGTDLEELGKRVVAAVELRYPDADDGQSDGAQLTVGVGRGFERFAPGCRALLDQGLTGCKETGYGLLFWEGATPEEDPGVVYLLASKGRTDVLLFSSGKAVTGDPRDLDLPVSVDEMAAIASDPRVDVTTSRSAIQAGEELGFWSDSGT
jgi:hypothetical protein